MIKPIDPINVYALIKDMVNQKADPYMTGRPQLSYEQADRLMFAIKDKITELRKFQKLDASDLLGWARFKIESAVCLMPHHKPAHVLYRKPFLVESWDKVPDEGSAVIWDPATWTGLTMAARQRCHMALDVTMLGKDYTLRIDKNHVDGQVSVEIVNNVTTRKRRIAVFTTLAFNQFIAGADHE